MLGRILNRLLVPAWKTPELVRWSSPTYEEDEAAFGKLIEHAGIVLYVELGITEQTFVLPIRVQNDSDKALAIGAAGVGLLFTFADGTKRSLQCRALKHRGQLHEVLTIESEAECQMSAQFDAAPLPEHVEAAIQVDRILAAPFLFSVPFRTDWGEEVRTYARQFNSPFRAR